MALGNLCLSVEQSEAAVSSGGETRASSEEDRVETDALRRATHRSLVGCLHHFSDRNAAVLALLVDACYRFCR